MRPVPHDPEDGAAIFEASLARLVCLNTVRKSIDLSYLRQPEDRP